MAALPFRAQQFFLSAIGALLFLPMYFFLGGVFSFWFAARDSMWAWGFNLTAFWCQILGIVASFFKPRTGAVWMLLNIALSVLMAIGYAAESVHDSAGTKSTLVLWLETAPGILKVGLVFWAAPLALAILLLREGPQQPEEV